MGHSHHSDYPATPNVASTSALGREASGAPPAEGPLASSTCATDNPGERTRRRGRPRREAKTLSGLHQKFLLYCEVERRLSPQTVTSYRSDFRQFTEFLRGQSRWGLVSQDVLGALSMGNVRDYQYYMAEQRWSPATVQRRLVSLNRFGAWLVKRGHAKTNPLAEMELPRKPRPLPRIVDWGILAAAAHAEPKPRDAAILGVLVYAGLRRGEVVGLEVGDFSPTAKTLHVRGKGNKDRVISLPKPAQKMLKTYLSSRANAGPEAPLFVTAAGQRITHKVVTRVVRRIGEQIGRHLHPHMFRHSYATELLDRGADIRDIRDLLGHESVATTEIYTHVSAARQRRVVELLEKPAARRPKAKTSAAKEVGVIRSASVPRPKDDESASSKLA
jgi:site-specific recombinase XerD